MLELLNRFGSISKTQEHLGISNRTMSHWVYEFDVKRSGSIFIIKPLNE